MRFASTILLAIAIVIKNISICSNAAYYLLNNHSSHGQLVVPASFQEGKTLPSSLAPTVGDTSILIDEPATTASAAAYVWPKNSDGFKNYSSVEGAPCWNKCRKPGPCKFCGPNKLCCKKGGQAINGCDGISGGNNRYECINKDEIECEDGDPDLCKRLDITEDCKLEIYQKRCKKTCNLCAGCEDGDPDLCKRLDIKEDCKIGNIRNRCQKTCNYCFGCVDVDPELCKRIDIKEECELENIEKRCKKTCNLCTGCKDQDPEVCKIIDIEEDCDRESIKKRCKKTCNLCAEYKPNGPQMDIPLAMVQKQGWSICYQGHYNTKLTDYMVQDIEDNKCTGSNIMLACGFNATGSIPSTLKVLAWSPRKYVFGHTTGQGVTANGNRWYRSTEQYKKSWGFAPEDGKINLGNWDKAKGPDRLSWTTHGQWAGFRCGETGTYLPAWKRIILQIFE